MKITKLLCWIYLAILGEMLSAQADLDRGLIAYYPLDSNGVNHSPNRLANTDFTMHQVTYNYGFEGPRKGASANFYGDGYGRLNEGLQSEAMSVSLWFNTAIKDRPSSLLAWDSRGYFLEILPGGKLHCGIYTSRSHYLDFILEGMDVANGEWRQVAMSLSQDDFKVYLDGKKVHQEVFDQASKVFYEPGGMQIGGLAMGQNKNYFTGRIDELYIYNRSLSEKEVELLYHKVRVLPDLDLETGLMFYLPFDSDDLNHSSNQYWSSQLRGYGGNLVESCNRLAKDERMKLFNGGEDYLMGSSAFAAHTFTLSFKFQTTTAKESFLMGWNNLGYQAILNPPAGSGKLAIKVWQSPTQSYSFLTPMRLNDGECHHVAISYDGKQLLIFIDGRLADDKAKFNQGQGISYKEGGAFMIGNESTQSSGRGYQGMIDEVRLYNRGLKANEILSLQAPKTIPESCQVRFYESKVESPSTFIAIFSVEGKKITFFEIGTNKELAQVKLKPSDPIAVINLKLGKSRIGYKVD